MTLNETQAAVRADRVGASEVAALLGEHPYVTPRDVYMRIVEGVQPEPNQNMRVGSFLEVPVLRLAERIDGLRARSCHRAYVHPELPLSCTPDAYTWPHRGYGRGLAEVKVTYGWAELPRYMYWQMQTQLLLTGREVCWMVALAGSRLRVFPVEPDPLAFENIEHYVWAFWYYHLDPRQAPPAPEPPKHVFTPYGQEKEGTS